MILTQHRLKSLPGQQFQCRASVSRSWTVARRYDALPQLPELDQDAIRDIPGYNRNQGVFVSKPVSFLLTQSVLREWRDSDHISLVENANNPNVARNLRDIFPSPYTSQHAHEW